MLLTIGSAFEFAPRPSLLMLCPRFGRRAVCLVPGNSSIDL